MSTPHTKLTSTAAADYTRIVDDLTYHYDGVFDRDSVQRAVDQARATLAPVAKFPNFLPILIERNACDQLLAAAQADGKVATGIPEILFVCVHNAGRSQMAAALARHLSAGKVHVRSAGSQPDQQIHPLTIQALAERGIEITQAFPKPLTDDVLRAADVIVTMGCGDACPVLPGKRYDDWGVADPAGQPIEVVRAIRDDIQARVTTLVGEILHQS
jgi:arsenate reductase (thioredoxin)